MSRDVLSGDLKFLELGELLQLLGMIGQSGVLYLESPWSSVQGRIHVFEGRPVDALDGQQVASTPYLLSLAGERAGLDFQKNRLERNIG
jgi:hypothetical protein